MQPRPPDGTRWGPRRGIARAGCTFYAPSMETLVLTVIGDDRPGLVAALSERLQAHNASWERSQMSRLAGKFAGIVEVRVSDRALDRLVENLAGLRSQDLDVTVARTSRPEIPARPRLSLDVVGADRPGIVAEISTLLSGREISIEDLTTEVEHAPMAGGMLFRAHAVLAAPAGVDQAELGTALEALADELMVEVALDEEQGQAS